MTLRASAGAQVDALRDRFRVQRWIVRVGGPGTWLVVGLAALRAVAAVIAVAFALVMRACIDQAVAGSSQGFSAAVCAFGVLLATQVGVLCTCRALSEAAQATLENRFRQQALAAMLEGDFGLASRRHTGDVSARMTSDARVVAEGATGALPEAASSITRLLGSLAVMGMLAPLLAAVLVAVGCLVGAVSLALRSHQKKLHRCVQEAESSVRCYVQECLESLLMVRSFGCERKVIGQSRRVMDEHLSSRMRKMAFSNACSTGLSAAMQGGYLLCFAWCGWGLLNGSVSYGTMMAVVQLTGQVQAPFAGLGSLFSRYASMLASAERLMELDQAVGRFSCAGGAYPGGRDSVAVPASSLESFGFDKAFFRYDQDGAREALCDCSFDVHAGEVVALVGESGAGKSTAMRLLLGAYQPDEGSAYVRAEGRRISASSVRPGLFAYVPQGNCLLSGTAREVVAFADGDGAPDDARVRDALYAACADEFVDGLPGGLDARLGERGAALSEGQRQRLAVARAVYSGAPVLLLDEATSALDTACEERMIRRLRELPDRTVLMATHRGRAVALCDRVVQVGGRVSTEGCPNLERRKSL